LNFGWSSPATINSNTGKAQQMQKQLSPSERGETFTVPRLDVHDLVTNIIISQLEKGVIPWQKPFADNSRSSFNIPFNYTTGNKYRGINVVLLWASALDRNYKTDEWASFKQWQSKNERIRKGEKGNLVVYYDTFEKDVEGELQKIPFLKASYVFNRCQLESYQPVEVYEPVSPRKIVPFERIDAVDLFINNTGAIIGHHDGGAYYDRKADVIGIPNIENFEEVVGCTVTESYCSVLFHELVHWSGAPHRLDRTKGKKFGDQNYANEELVAEFGAAFLCAEFGLNTAEKGNHAAYIDNWLQVLKEDKKCIFRTASEASKAVDYLINLQAT